MAELSLIAGMNYFENKGKDTKTIIKNKKTNDQIILDSYIQSPYHSTTISESSKEYDKMYEKNMDSAKYMIPSYFVPEDDELVLGAGTDHISKDQESFETQFDLQASKSHKVRAGNERGEGFNTINSLTSKWSNFNSQGDDMTLGVIDKDSKEFRHNNMHEFNRMRDFIEPDYEDNRPLEAFTGYSEHYVPKRERKPLFEPVKNSSITNDARNLISLEEERMHETVGLKKNGQRLMEPKQNAPVLGLGVEDEFYSGGYDSTRIMPKTSNELRRADKQQISYQAPMMHGKKGSKRPTMPVFEKRSANLVEEGRETFRNGGISKQQNNDNITVKDTNRKVSRQIIGPKAGLTSVFAPQTQGKIKQSEKTIYNGQVGQASMIGKLATQDAKSIQVFDTQRMYTSTEYRGNLAGNISAPVLDKSEYIRGKQDLGDTQTVNATFGIYSAHGVSRPVFKNYNEKINSKQELGRQNDGHAARGTIGNRTIDYNENINSKQELGRQNDGHAARGAIGHQ